MPAPWSQLSVRFWLPVALGRSADPSGDLKRGDELVSQALALDPNYPNAHLCKAVILLMTRGANDESDRGEPSARSPWTRPMSDACRGPGL